MTDATYYAVGAFRFWSGARGVTPGAQTCGQPDTGFGLLKVRAVARLVVSVDKHPSPSARFERFVRIWELKRSFASQGAVEFDIGIEGEFAAGAGIAESNRVCNF